MSEIQYLSHEDRTIPFIESFPDEQPSASVLLIHGIFQHKNEDGRFSRLAQHLKDEGFHSVRFDYAGHGGHSIEPESLTVATALADIHKMLQYLEDSEESSRVFVVATSFGASLFLLYLRLLRNIAPQRIVLLNPVTDYDATFVEPVEEDMKEIFTADKIDKTYSTGSSEFLPEKGFTFSLPFLMELELYEPYQTFPSLEIPTKVIHGDADNAVPYELTKDHSCQSPAVDFHTIEGADHAFMEPQAEAECFDVTTDFLQDSL